MVKTTVPTNAIGHPGGYKPVWRPGANNIFEVDPFEPTPELVWPYNVMVYDQMRRTDGQVGGTLRAMTLPILSANWDFETEGVRPEVVELCRTELGIQKPGESRRRRRRQGINWLDHCRMALQSVYFGHMPFEQVYEVGPPAPGQENIDLETVIHLRKLDPRPPRTLTEIRVAADGGLAGISQPPIELTPGVYKERFIPVDQLVMYCMDREGADWTGNSILRTVYKNWLIKDILIRSSAQIVERNGMGVPVMSYDENTEGASRAEAERVVQEFRAGASAGVVKPVGTTFELVGVNGSTVDPLPVINYHDQAIAKGALAMFMDLGHDAGARSLGDTFVDFFTQSLQAVADQIADTATEHVVRDLVEWNYGPDEPYPLITPGELKNNQNVTATTLSTLVNAGIITPDGKLEKHVRTSLNLPDSDPATARPKDAPAPAPNEAGTVLPLSEGVSNLDKMAYYSQRFLDLQQRHGHGS
ncbi:portal protein [Arthrobacter phage KBurrousTX]|uniref:Portal protein n=1 Tax=Arthrobacter phage KBurrousTX TaxID=2315608 RepID=A0A386K835_9CAUD|nr:portal protein [Arthrobacter phage KBurrousTX]AYD81498.1 portal protein [Arthrobacter phage KBurrousTX]